MTDIHKHYENGVRTNDALTCPQCGAPIEDEKCPYCGVVFYDFACVDTKKPFFLKIKHEGKIHIYKVRMDAAEVTYSNNDTHLWSDNRVYDVMCSPDIDINMNFHVVE